DHVPGRDKDGNSSGAAVGGRRNLRDACDFDFRGAGSGVVIAGGGIQPQSDGDHRHEQGPRQPSARRRTVAIDAQARQIADRSGSFFRSCHWECASPRTYVGASAAVLSLPPHTWRPPSGGLHASLLPRTLLLHAARAWWMGAALRDSRRRVNRARAEKEYT